MKINEILNNITLKLPGGGNLALGKYAPYITNAEEDVEGLSGGMLMNMFDGLNNVPEGYLLANTPYFSSEHDAWAYRYISEYGGDYNIRHELEHYDDNGYCNIYLTPNELAEQIDIQRKVFGWNMSTFDVTPVYKDNNIEDDLIIKISVGYDSIHIEISKPILITEDLTLDEPAEDKKGGKIYNNSDFIEIVNDLNAQGLYIYGSIYDFGESMPERPEIPQDIKDELQNSGGDIVK